MSGAVEMRGLDATGAVYFDGDVPTPRAVTALHRADDALEITCADGQVIRWPLHAVRLLPDIAAKQPYVLRWTGDPLARLVTPNPFVLAALPQPKRRAPPKGRARLMAWAGAAVSAVAFQIFVLVPLLADNLAGFIPPKGERALGEATLGHIREVLDETGMSPLEVCTGAEGIVVLEDLARRLGPAEPGQTPVILSVLDHEMINAFALPGGYVVLFKGLIDAAETPDEVAAVVAHEIGHVISRDPTRHALRSAGSIGVLGLLFGDFGGGAAVVFMVERLIAAQYSQAAEAGADEFAHRALNKAGISPAALGGLFKTLKDKHGDHEGLTAHFMTHPQLRARIAAAEAAVVAGTEYAPALSAADWQVLQKICD